MKTAFRGGLLIVMVFSMILSLFGCGGSGGKIPAEQARRLMEETLSRKYGRDFQVGEPEFRHSSGPFNDIPGWTSPAVDPDSGQTFTVEYDSNDGSVTDDYAKCLFGGRFETEAREILSGPDGLTVEMLYGVYPLSADNWAREDGYSDYIRLSGAYISGRLRLPETAGADSVRSLCAALRQLDDGGIFFSLSVYHGSRCVVFSHEPGTEMPDLDGLAGKFSLGE